MKTQIVPVQVKMAKRLVSTFESAQKRSKEFNLGLSYLINISEQTRCAYSGELFTYDQGPDSMTLERFDNDVGYIEGNVIPVKKRYNSLRSDLELPDVIAKRDTLSARIVRAVDAGKSIENLNCKGNEVHVSPEVKKMQILLGRTIANIKGRETALASRNGQDPDLEKSLRARIDGGYAEVGRLKKRIQNAMMNGGKQTKKSKASEAEQRAHEYNMIIKGLTRFQKLSYLDRKKLGKGLPLDASLMQLLRGKM